MAKLSPDGKRIRAIIISAPFLIASSILLYKRLVLGEEQRLLPKMPPQEQLDAFARSREQGKKDV